MSTANTALLEHTRLDDRRLLLNAADRLHLLVAAFVYLEAVVAACACAASSHVWWPVTATFVAAVAAFYFVDVRAAIRIPTWLYNIMVVASGLAVVASTAYLHPLRDLNLLAAVVGSVLLPLFLETKTARTYWDIICVTTIQVVLTAAVARSFNFGFFLVVYVFVSVAVLALLIMWQGHFAALAAMAGHDPNKIAVAKVKGSWSRVRKVAGATFFVGPMSLFLRFAEEDRAEAVPDIVGHGGRRADERQMAPITNIGFALSLLGWRWWGRIATAFLAALFVGALVFVAIPRVGPFSISLPKLGALLWGADDEEATTGFGDRIQLGQIGQLIENPEEVFRAFLTVAGSDEPLETDDPLYFRGAVLTRYAGGVWESGPTSWVSLRLLRSSHFEKQHLLVEQTLVIRPTRHDQVFALWPFVVTRPLPQLRFDGFRQLLYRAPPYRGKSIVIQAATSALENGVQVPLVPARVPVDVQTLTEWPAATVPSASTLAGQWLAEVAAGEADVVRKATILAAKLRDSGDFMYTLQPEPVPEGMDPIEYFLTKSRKGHCEYFASALALLLRSQGIACRVVVGYRTNEYDALGNFYRARQSHAHAWVEVYVPPEQLPASLPEIYSSEDWSFGAWLRVDPTPPFSYSFFSLPGLRFSLRSWLDQLQTFWTIYVAGLDRYQQRLLIVEPLQRLASAVGNTIRGISETIFAGASTWLGAVIIVLAGMLLVALTYCAANVLKRLARPSMAKVADEVAFYQEIERLLARLGIVRAPAQTQRQFATAAAAHLDHSLGKGELPQLLLHAADAFYLVRFGAGKLDNESKAAIARTLMLLREVAVKYKNRRSIKLTLQPRRIGQFEG